MGRKKVINKKFTWADIYKDFKRVHPKLSVGALGFRPHGVGEIVVYYPDNKRMIYNHDTGRIYKFVAE